MSVQCSEMYEILSPVSEDYSMVWYGRTSEGEDVILKFFPTNDLENYVREREMTQKASEIGIGPRFIDSYTCNLNGDIVHTIVTEKLEMTLSDVLKEQIIDGKNNMITIDQLIRIFYLIYTAYRNGIHYLDLWIDNIMVDREGRLYLIDMGSPSYLGSLLDKDSALQKAWEAVSETMYDPSRPKRPRNKKNVLLDLKNYLLSMYNFEPRKTERELRIEQAQMEQQRRVEEALARIQKRNKK